MENRGILYDGWYKNRKKRKKKTEKLNDKCIKSDQTTSGGKDKHMHRQTDRQTDIQIYHTCGYTATPAKYRWVGPVFKVT